MKTFKPRPQLSVMSSLPMASTLGAKASSPFQRVAALYQDMTINLYVIEHPEWGYFLGRAMGLGFWSKLDPAGQVCCFALKKEEDIRNFIRFELRMDDCETGGVEPLLITGIPVVSDYIEHYVASDEYYLHSHLLKELGLHHWV